MKTYSGIYERVSEFLNRDDMDQVIPTMVRLAELQIFRFLRVKLNEKIKVYTAADDPYSPLTVPVDYKQARLLVINEAPLEKVSDQRYYESLDGYSGTDQPQYWTEVLDKIYILPWRTETQSEEDWGDVNITLHYFTADASDLVTLGEDCFIYGGLMHSAIYLKAPQNQIALYQDMFNKCLLSLDQEYQVQRYAGSTKQVTSAY